MTRSIEEILSGLEVCSEILESEQRKCEQLSQQIVEWLAQGQRIRKDIEDVAGVCTETLQNWSGIREGLVKKLAREREEIDPADFWKYSNKE